jgi:hypothetical protein
MVEEKKIKMQIAKLTISNLKLLPIRIFFIDSFVQPQADPLGRTMIILE